MNSLIIETSTEKGVLICVKNNEILAVQEFLCGYNQSKLLMPCLISCMRASQMQVADLSCIGVGVGPGSYTGMRVGASVAQGLAYSHNLPLIEIPSLTGFVPSKKISYAAIVDARVSGAYLYKNLLKKEREINTALTEVCALENLADYLGEIDYLVTPNCENLKSKLKQIYPEREWEWEERFPCAETLVKFLIHAFSLGNTKKANELQLNYLRSTLAERQKEQKLARQNEEGNY